MNGVMFDNKHSYRDWGLFLKNRPVISPPTPKTVYIDVPGSDGSLDLTESLTGDVKYENRKIKLEFVVLEARNRWSNVYSEILDYIHGQQMRVILDEDPTYYYYGRLQVNEWASSKATSTITVEGLVEPYKNELFGSLDDWEWDPFNFETGIVRDYENLVVEGTLSFTIEGNRKPVVPSFIVNSSDGEGMTVNYNGQSYNLKDGTNRVVNIKVKNGTNVFLFTGNGTVSIDYRGGRL